MNDSIKICTDPINGWLIVSGEPKEVLDTVVGYLKVWRTPETFGWFLSILTRPDFLERASNPLQKFTLYSRHSSLIRTEMIDNKLRLELRSRAHWFPKFLRGIQEKTQKS